MAVMALSLVWCILILSFARAASGTSSKVSGIYFLAICALVLFNFGLNSFRSVGLQLLMTWLLGLVGHCMLYKP